MISIKNLFKSKFFTSGKGSVFFAAIIGLIVAGLFSVTFYAFATPPISPYAPGESTDPTCNPGDPNCTVVSSVPYTGATSAVDLGSQNFSTTGTGSFGALSATGITSSGTITFSNLSTNGGVLYTDASGDLEQTVVGSAGQVLTSNGTGLAPTWQNAGGAGANPGGSTTELQYNNGGSFGGIAGVTADGVGLTSIGVDLTGSTTGDTYYLSGGKLNRLPIASTNDFLTVASGLPAWSTNSFSIQGDTSFTGAYPFAATLTGSTNVTFPTSGTLVNTSVTSLPSLTGVSTLTSGGATSGFLLGNVTTDLGSDATGDIYYRNSSGNLARLSPGSSNQVLTVSGGLPSWQNVPGAALTVGTSTITSGTNTYIEYNNNGVLGEYPITGSGNVVLSTSPTLVTPTLGAASATSINGLAITSSTGTLTIGNGKTLTASDSATLATNAITLGGGEVVTFTASNPLTLTTTGSTNVTFPTSGTLVNTSVTSLPSLTGVSTLTSGGATSGFLLGNVTTDLGSDATGDIYYRNSSGNLARLSPGSSNQVLTVSGGLPSWQNVPGAALTVGTSTITSGTNTYIEYNNNGVLGEYPITGSGNVVLSTSPTLVTPTLGAASATSINGLAITSSTGTLTIGNGKTLTASDSATLATNAITLGGGEVVTFTASNPLTLTTTGSTNVTFPTSGTLVNTSVTSLPSLTGVSTLTSGGATSGFLLGNVTTDLGSDATGDIYYRNSSGNLARLSPGSSNQVLTVSGGLPSWQNVPGAALTVGTSTITSGTNTYIEYNNNGVLGEYPITGSGNVVLSTSPTLVTPTLGAASATSINGLAITSSTGTLTIGNGKTLTASDSATLATNAITLGGGEVVTFTASNPLTLTTTGSTNVTFPTSGTLVNTSVTSLPSLTGVSTLTSGGATSGFLLGNVTTDLGSDATGDIYYRNSSGNLARLSPGSSNQVLTVSGGLPSWQNVPGAALTVGTSTITSGTNTYIEYNNNGVLGEYPITGSGNVVLSTSPTLVTPTLGAASATSINGLAITSSTGTLTIGNGKTLTASDSATLATNAITLGGGEVVTFTASNPLTLTTTGSTNVTFPTSGTLVNTSVTSLPSLTGVSTLTSGGATSGFLLGNVTTDLGSDATGDIYYRNSSGNLARLSPGSSNQVLTVSGGLPSWQNVPGAALTVGTSTITSGTNTYIEYNNNGVLGEYPITGSGNVVLSTSPTLVTPTLGAASATSLTAANIYGGSGVSSTLTLSGTSNGSPSNAYVILNGSGQGKVGIGLAAPLGTLSISSGNITGANSAASESVIANSLTTGTDLYLNSSSVTTGKLFDLATTGGTWTGNGITNGLVNLTSTSTAGAASASNILLDLTRSGANTNSSVTSYGSYTSVTNTGTTSTNVAEYLNASGATNNYGLIVNSGYVGIGTTAPSRSLDVLNANSVPQLRLTNVAGSTYGELYADSAGDLHISSSNGNVRLLNENLYVCSGGSCSNSAPAGEGSLVVANGIITGQNGINGGSIGFYGSTSGMATLTVAVAAGSPTLTLPATTGTLAELDANSNISANNFLAGYTTTATAAGTTTLTVSSAFQEYFTGSTAQTVVLPVVSTLALGQSFQIVNNSTGIVTVNSSGSNLIFNVTPNTSAIFTCILTSGTSAASWSINYQNGDEAMAAMQQLGSAIKGQSFGINPALATNTLTLMNQKAYFNLIYVPYAQTLTGVKWFQNGPGSYTANNNNYIALYSYSGGTLTQVAITANNGNLWKGAGPSWQSAAFTSTYPAQPGVYYVGFLYCESGQTTAPVIKATPLLTSGLTSVDFANSAAFEMDLTAQTSLPNLTATTSLGVDTNQAYFMVY